MKRTLDYIHTYQIEIFQVINKLKYYVMMFVDSVVFVGFIDLLVFFFLTVLLLGCFFFKSFFVGFFFLRALFFSHSK